MYKRIYFLAQIPIVYVYVYTYTIKALYRTMPCFPNTIAYYCPAEFLPPAPAFFSPWEIWICSVWQVHIDLNRITSNLCWRRWEGHLVLFCAYCQQKNRSFIVATVCEWGVSGILLQVLGIWKWKDFTCATLVGLIYKRNRISLPIKLNFIS